MEALKIETGRLGSSEAGMFKDEGSSLNAESRKGTSKVFDRWRQWNSELGPGVVLLVAELCRGYRCGVRKIKAKGKA